jgi:hypothetical protein
MRKRSIAQKSVSFDKSKSAAANQTFHTSEPTVAAENQPRCLTPQTPHPKNEGLSPLIERALNRSGLSYDSFVRLLTQGAFKAIAVWTSSDLDRLLIAAERYGLDPLSREIFMMQSNSDPTSALLLVIGVDGWTHLINAHEQFEGIEFAESPELEHGVPALVECTIYRRDRRVPLKLREYFCEARGEHLTWITHPRRMLRHKALVQCARIAFGLTGVFDADEAQRLRYSKVGDDRFIGAQKLAQKLAISTPTQQKSDPL